MSPLVEARSAETEAAALRHRRYQTDNGHASFLLRVQQLRSLKSEWIHHGLADPIMNQLVSEVMPELEHLRSHAACIGRSPRRK